MKLIPFNHDSSRHVADLLELFVKRKMDFSLLKEIPSFALMAYNGENLVAFGGVRRVEGDIGMLDSFITNPEIDPQIRHIALDKITAKMIRLAAFYEVKMLLAFSEDGNTITRAETHGFTTFPNHKFQMIKVPQWQSE